MNIADTALGLASDGDSTDALGISDDMTVSLGDGGSAIVTFNHPVFNGPGFDFAVFENGFSTNDSNLAFLELAFVEVSTDGIRFVRFPAVSHVEDTVQTGPFSPTDCSQLYDLAGKYKARYGTPFDLEELIDSPGIDVNNINYVKVIDVVGSIDSAYATHDHEGNIVNDPWPTPFASCGFDLDAVGVINSKGATGIAAISQGDLKLFPNPVQRGKMCSIQLPENICSLKLYDLSGQLIYQWQGPVNSCWQSIGTAALSSSIYLLQAETANSHYNAKLVVE
jgi:hypothetical protein